MKTRGFEIVSKYQGRGIELPQRKTAASAGAHGRHRAGTDGDGADGTQGVHAER